MAEIDDEFKNAIGNTDEGIEDGGEEEAVEEQKPKLTPAQEAATVGAVVDFTGALVAKVKRVPSDLTPQFLADYHAMSDPLLTLIGFGDALSKLPISSLSPTKTVLLGGGMLLVAAFFTKAPVPVQQRNANAPGQTQTPDQATADAQARQAASIIENQSAQPKEAQVGVGLDEDSQSEESPAQGEEDIDFQEEEE